ncbi:hypothetical protein ASE82_04735 [Sphingomonas sp. Leaf230]|uniref:DUF3833 family protein n=1 Tax=Sphingomonas sp. Leaf230 TaxID=1735694 RepID=UPI0007123A30|nr:DUF3833 family protein [Sphingomonas sp. Leaf230]KQN06186.1 hypothetical protein ASE82_04735 [Sphingomonas sp. Leaf230]
MTFDHTALLPKAPAMMPFLTSRPAVAIAFAVLVSACAGAPPVANTSGAAPRFVAERFFAGRLDGVGTLKIVLHAPVTTHVISIGRVGADGILLLDQHIEQQGKPARDRQWRIRPLGNGRYKGTLTDASGPVTGEVEGNRLHLGFSMKGGMCVDQWLRLSSDGQVAQNHLIVRKLGVTVATLEETIRKLP